MKGCLFFVALEAYPPAELHVHARGTEIGRISGLMFDIVL